MIKVRYIGCSKDQATWGSCDDPRRILKNGAIYTLKTHEVHSFHTIVTLMEVPDLKFNSVCFEGTK